MSHKSYKMYKKYRNYRKYKESFRNIWNIRRKQYDEKTQEMKKCSIIWEAKTNWEAGRMSGFWITSSHPWIGCPEIWSDWRIFEFQFGSNWRTSNWEKLSNLSLKVIWRPRTGVIGEPSNSRFGVIKQPPSNSSFGVIGQQPIGSNWRTLELEFWSKWITTNWE